MAASPPMAHCNTHRSGSADVRPGPAWGGLPSISWGPSGCPLPSCPSDSVPQALGQEHTSLSLPFRERKVSSGPWESWDLQDARYVQGAGQKDCWGKTVCVIPLLLLPSIFPSIRVFCSESALCMRWPKLKRLSSGSGHVQGSHLPPGKAVAWLLGDFF